MRTPFSLAATLLATTVCLFCQPGGDPVPAQWLHGSRLVVPEFNFSIDSPTPGSHWLYRRNVVKVGGHTATAFTVDAGAGGVYTLLVSMGTAGVDSTNKDSFIEQARKSLPKGWRVEDSNFQQTSIPLKDTTHFSVTVRQPDGAALYWHGYSMSGYTLANYSKAATEPPLFRRFVESFALLSPDSGRSPSHLAIILAALVILGAVAAWRFIGGGGRRPLPKTLRNLFIAAGVTAACIGLVQAVFWIVLHEFASLSELSMIGAGIGASIYYSLTMWTSNRNRQ